MHQFPSDISVIFISQFPMNKYYRFILHKSLRFCYSLRHRMDMQKIIKLLNLSTSDFDGEALSAIRKANALLKAANKTWDSFLFIDTKSDSHTYKEPPKKPRTRSGFRGFYESKKNGNYYNPKLRATAFEQKTGGWSWAYQGKFGDGGWGNYKDAVDDFYLHNNVGER
jgi:hypothetical protein